MTLVAFDKTKRARAAECKEFKNGQLVEKTRDYQAQHKDGDVWSFGEDVDDYWNGMLLNHSGSVFKWTGRGQSRHLDEARRRFLQAGIYPGHAEDIRDTVATGETVTTKSDTYTGSSAWNLTSLG